MKETKLKQHNTEKVESKSTEKIHIETIDFSVYYAGVEAVKKVSIKFLQNKITAIIGPSGCGKSTLLRAINRMNDLIPACSVSGKMLFANTDIYDRRTDVVKLRKRIGMVFQKPNVFPKTIFDNVAYGPKLQGKKNKSEINELVEKSLRRAALWDEVKDRLNKNAIGISGGQQQRLCIARALAIKPEILLMDEPTSALDPKSTAKIEDLIGELQNDYTIIIVTHNMQQAARVSQFTTFMYEGNMVEFGKTEHIFTAPDNKATEDYITGRFG